MEDLQLIRVVPVPFLLENVLPKLPESFNMERVTLSLQSADIIDRDGNWNGFPSPKKAKCREEAAFLPLQKIYDGIVKAVGLNPVLAMKHNPNYSPLSERANTSRPDAILKLVKRKSLKGAKDDWEDIPVSMEFKKKDTDKDIQDVRTICA
jgi:hypothetical protein